METTLHAGKGKRRPAAATLSCVGTCTSSSLRTDRCLWPNAILCKRASSLDCLLFHKRQGAALRMQVEQLQADARASSGGAGDQQAAAVAARRWGAQLEWVREVTALVGALSGVGIASIDEDAVTLTLTTHAEAGDAAAGPRKHGWPPPQTLNRSV